MLFCLFSCFREIALLLLCRGAGEQATHSHTYKYRCYERCYVFERPFKGLLIYPSAEIKSRSVCLC